jgi:putative transposase
VSRLCALYGVSRAGFYAWQRRRPSAHAKQDQLLTQRLVTLFRRHQGRYGSPRLHRALRREGARVSRRRVERLMRAAGLRARVALVYRANPALHQFFDRHPNQLTGRAAPQPNQIWVGDITYLRLVSGAWRFLAVIVDQCSRRVVAWALGARRDAMLTRRVLDAAVRRRRPGPGLIFHSDRGSEYAAEAFHARLCVLGVRQSASRRGPEDNAHMESFFHSLKAELVHGAGAFTEPALRRVIGNYVRYYNHIRMHSALAYRSPVEYESEHV